LKSKDRRLIVFLDGINEDGDPKKLLSYTSDLVREVSESPFVKIIISCRSSFWDMLSKMGILDNKAFYRADGQWEIQLARFTEEELREAFELYKRQYDLKTTYEELSEKRMNRVKTLVADPLMLRLVAEVYKGREIAADISSVAVFKQYCDGKMTEAKDRWLVKQLTRKMRDKATDYLIIEELWKDEQLAKEVMSHEVDSSFVHMVDAGVLQLSGGYLGTGLEYSRARVKFAHDRVHEYLLAEEEIPIVRKQGAGRLIELIEESKIYSPIWGATKRDGSITGWNRLTLLAP